ARPGHCGSRRRSADLSCRRVRDGWECSVVLQRVQAGDTVVSQDALLIGSKESGEVRIPIEIYADESPAPTRDELTVVFEVSERTLSVSDVVEEAHAALDRGR